MPSLTELYHNYTKANGGRSGIAGIQSLIVNCESLSDAPGVKPVSLKIYRKRPSKMRMIIDYGDSSVETITDGEQVWKRWESVGGEVRQEEVTGADREDILRDVYIDGPFYRMDGREDYLEVEAIEEINGEPAVRLKVLPDAPMRFDYIWLSLEHFQEVQLSRPKVSESGEEKSERMVFSHFTKTQEVWFARKIEFYSGETLLRGVNVHQIRVNPGLFDSLFTLN